MPPFPSLAQDAQSLICVSAYWKSESEIRRMDGGLDIVTFVGFATAASRANLISDETRYLIAMEA